MKQTFTTLKKHLLQLCCLLFLLTAPAHAQTGDVPTITFESSMVPFSAPIGSEETQSYNVSGYNIAPGEPVLIETSGYYTISLSSSSGFSQSVKISEIWDGRFDHVPVWVKYTPTSHEERDSNAITHSSAGAETKILYLVRPTPIPLPVTLTTFSAKLSREVVILEWATASERDNSHFDVRVSLNPVAGFTTAGRVPSKVVNSSVLNEYRFEYLVGTAPGTYYFRLKQVDLDGTSSYSGLVSVRISVKPETAPALAPNPVTKDSKILLTSAEGGRMNIVITNMVGASVYTSSCKVAPGNNKIPLLLPDSVSKGIYCLTTELGGRYSRLRFVKN